MKRFFFTAAVAVSSLWLGLQQLYKWRGCHHCQPAAKNIAECE